MYTSYLHSKTIILQPLYMHKSTNKTSWFFVKFKEILLFFVARRMMTLPGMPWQIQSSNRKYCITRCQKLLCRETEQKNFVLLNLHGCHNLSIFAEFFCCNVMTTSRRLKQSSAANVTRSASHNSLIYNECQTQ